MRVMSTTRTQVIGSEQEINDGMAEIELQKLQRQYRIMEGDRKAYSEESRILISKQRASIEKLKRDNQHLADELHLLGQRNDDKKRNGAQSKKAEQLSEQAENYQKKIRLILAEIQALDNAINAAGKDIDAQRANLGGIHAASQNNDAILKQVRVLENRLDKALVKFNNALAVNKSLRASIDNLRRERLVFDNIYRKFERELLEQKKQMADIIEMSNAAYEARDEAQAKIIALREKAEKEYQNYIQEIKELDRTLEQDRKLKEFMATKISDRTEKGERTNDELKPLEKDANNTTTKFASTEFLAQSLETYEKAFEDIRKVTNIKDIGELVQKFNEIEDTNFSLFNYVNEISNEIELEAEGIVSIQRKMDELKVEFAAEEEKRKELLKSLEDKLNQGESKTSFFNSQILHMNQWSSEIRGGIDSLLEAVSSLSLSTPTPASAIAEGEGEVAGKPVEESSPKEDKKVEFASPSPESNLLSKLAHVEQKTNDLLTLHLAVNAPKNKATLVIGEDGIPKEMAPVGGTVGGLLGQGPSAPLGKITIVPPSTGDDHDSDDNLTDEDERPLTKEEIKAKTLKGISRRAEKAVVAPVKAVTNKGIKKRKN